MEQNYYEILEVNKNASSEIIDKAYKTLIKKYHPDLQTDDLKNEYEEKIKKINEAYEILSDPEKRKNYDLSIKNTEISSEAYDDLYNENINLKNEINYLKNNSNTTNTNSSINNDTNNKNDTSKNIEQNNINKNEINEYFKKELNNTLNKAYHDAYIQDLKNRGYKIKYKKTFKDFLALIITIAVIILIIFILWQIPFFKNNFINFYNNNPILKTIIDTFTNLFK